MKVAAVGICGGTGSGKTTLAGKIARIIGEGEVLLLSQDRYYRDLGAMSPQQRSAVNFDHPDAIDFDALVRDVRLLKSARSIHAPRYDFATHTRHPDAETLGPRKIVLVEGLFVLRPPQLRELLDYSVFLYAPDDIRFIRRLGRDLARRGRSPQDVINQYLDTVRPMHERYIQPQRQFADEALDTHAHLDVDSLARRILALAEGR